MGALALLGAGAMCLAQAPQFVPSNQATTLLSPFRAIVIDGDPHVTTLGIAADAHATLGALDRVMLRGMPLSDVRRVDLELRPLDIFTPDAVLIQAGVDGEQAMPRPRVVLLHGTIAGDPSSRVIMGVTPTGMNGLIESAEGLHIIATGLNDDPRTVIYHAGELPAERIDLVPFICGTDELDPHTDGPRPDSGRGAAGAVPRMLRLAIDCDYEFYQRFASSTDAASAYVATLIGAVAQIYRNDFNASVRISFLRVWATPEDPWTEPNAQNQLAQFRSYWLANGAGIERKAAHLLTVRQLAGAGGVAYLGGLCSSFGYGLSGYLNGFFPMPLQSNRPQNWDVMVVAHELGHNIGAPHTHSMSPVVDSCGLGDCSQAGAGTIMSYCHTCPGGVGNIALTMQDRVVNERVLPFLNGLSCDMTAPTACFADFNRDTAVDGADLSTFLALFGQPVPPWGPGDTNGDATVNGSDLSVFLYAFGQMCN